MAAIEVNVCRRPPIHMVTIFMLLLSQSQCLLQISPANIFERVENSCVVVATSIADDNVIKIVEQLEFAFRLEDRVSVGVLTGDLNSFSWEEDREIELKWLKSGDRDIALFSREKIDRTCLIPAPRLYPNADNYSGPKNFKAVLDFVNSKCETYRSANGYTSVEGLHREHVLENLFHVSHTSNCTSGVAFRPKSPKSCGSSKREDACGGDDDKGTVSMDTASLYSGQDINMAKCQRIPMPSKEEFFQEFLKRSKPVIITDAMQNWDALKKWSNIYLRKLYGDKKIHIKLAPHGEFEGCEPARIWEDHRVFKIPQKVRDQLSVTDLVVVRPATLDLNFSEFVDMIENKTLKVNNVSAYLEYSSIPEYMPELEDDIQEFPFVKGRLSRRHLNIWISDGNTLGKLHFDPFDNFLCMISGKKQLIIFDPHDNTQMYEGHIPEAILGYQTETGKFRRKKLLDSTSMVMSPIDILDPELKRFPKFSKTYPMNCTISEGEALFMPAFWWHEVQSFPSVTENRNIAVNYWYEPFLTKEFPCPTCKLDVNPFYSHLL